MEISGREVSDEILRKVIGAAFKAPTNDHLRQLEFVVVRGRENMLLAAANEGLGAVFHIPVGDEADSIKKAVNAPEGYEFACLLTIGYPAENAFLPRQKEINIEDRIHANVW